MNDRGTKKAIVAEVTATPLSKDALRRRVTSVGNNADRLLDELVAEGSLVRLPHPKHGRWDVYSIRQEEDHDEQD